MMIRIKDNEFAILFYREENRRQNSKPGTVPNIPEKEKHTVGVVK